MKYPHSFKGLREAYALRHEPEQYTRLARTYWIFLLIFSALLMTLGIGYGVWQFLVPPTPPITAEAGQGIMGFNKVQLQVVVEHFEKRRAAFESMMSE